jgi:hypothetical protein
MGIATHLGPWVLGTVRSTTGTTVGTIRNTGATIVAQTKDIVLADGTATVTAMSLPAGALVTSMQFIVPTTAFTAGTITISIGGTVYASGVTLPTALGISAVTTTTTSAAAAIVGSIDELVTYAMTGPTGAGASVTLVVAYMVRRPDGTYVPTAFTGP